MTIRKVRALAFMLTGLVLISAPSTALARLIVRSPDGVVSDSDAIIVGTVLSRAETRDTLDVTVQVDRVLKGMVRIRTIELSVGPYGPSESPPDAFPAEGTRVFVALRDASGRWALTTDLNAVGIVEYGHVVRLHHGSKIGIDDRNWEPGEYVSAYDRFYRSCISRLPFPDLVTHWSLPIVEQAVAAGWVSGYPDRTFRPDVPVTRAEFVKLLVEAGGLPQVDPNSYRVFGDVDGHWAFDMGYVARAGPYGLFDSLWYGTTFEPDKPMSRLEAVIMAMGLLGRNHQAMSGSTVARLVFEDSTDIPEWARGWVAQAVRDGVVKGYPDNTFLQNQAVTRAEAVAIVQRAVDLADAGLDPTLRLVVEGKEHISLPLSRKDDIIYAPASAIYGSLSDTHVWFLGDRLRVFPGNGVFHFDRARIQIVAGAPFAYLSRRDTELVDGAMERLPMLAATYMRRGEMMLPVASSKRDGSLPYASGRFDAETGTVHVTVNADWPGNSLPGDLSQARLVFRTGVPPLQPLRFAEVSRPYLEDRSGNLVVLRAPVPVTYSVDTASPVRLCEVTVTAGRLIEGPPVTQLTPGSGKLVYCTVPGSGRDVLIPEGQFAITANVPGMEPATTRVTVEDKRPCAVSVEVAPVGDKTSECSVTVRLLDNRGRLVDMTFRIESGCEGPSVEVTAPDGTTIAAQPVKVRDPASKYEVVMYHGVARFSFSPAGPGKYRVAATGLVPYRLWGDELCRLEGFGEVTVPDK